jgi:hypothetical protein
MPSVTVLPVTDEDEEQTESTNCDPCWFNDLSLRTGAILIAIFGIVSICNLYLL